MPVILPLVLQSVWPACLPFRPPQGLAGRPWAPGRCPPFWFPRATEFFFSMLPAAFVPQLSFFHCTSVQSFQPHRPSSTHSQFMLICVERSTCLILKDAPICITALFSWFLFLKSLQYFLSFAHYFSRSLCFIPDTSLKHWLKLLSCWCLRSVWSDRWGSPTLTFQLCVRWQSCPCSLPRMAHVISAREWVCV